MKPQDIHNILRQTPESASLVPILKRFEGSDPLVYAEVAKALLDAYRAGTKTGRETAEESIKEAFKWTGEG